MLSPLIDQRDLRGVKDISSVSWPHVVTFRQARNHIQPSSCDILLSVTWPVGVMQSRSVNIPVWVKMTVVKFRTEEMLMTGLLDKNNGWHHSWTHETRVTAWADCLSWWGREGVKYGLSLYLNPFMHKLWKHKSGLFSKCFYSSLRMIKKNWMLILFNTF